MKKLVIDLVNKLLRIKKSNPKLYKTGLIVLWCLAPIEMACIKFGVWGFKKVIQ